MNDALIGHSGFVGGSLLRQHEFTALYRSVDIGSIAGRSFDVLVCAGAPGAKWIANGDPMADRGSISRLMEALATVQCARLVLVSTVDVFRNPDGVDELSEVETDGLSPYGLHRHELEQFVRRRFATALIVRLPGLVGPGLRKNVIFDLHNSNALDSIDSRAVYQFYPVEQLWHDIGLALAANLRLLHLTAAPVGVADLARQVFGLEFTQTRPAPAAKYDFRTRHAGIFGASGHYQYSREQSLAAARRYAQSEPRAI